MQNLMSLEVALLETPDLHRIALEPAYRLRQGCGLRRHYHSAIIAPAGHEAIGPHPAGVGAPGADGSELPPQRRGLARFIIAPAGHGAARPHPAGVAEPGADGNELPLRRRGLARFIIAPAGHGAACPRPAGVGVPGADGNELPLRRRGLARFIIAPSGRGAVGPYPAGVGVPGADGSEARRVVEPFPWCVFGLPLGGIGCVARLLRGPLRGPGGLVGPGLLGSPNGPAGRVGPGGGQGGCHYQNRKEQNGAGRRKAVAAVNSPYAIVGLIAHSLLFGCRASCTHDTGTQSEP